eukprot:TRINITY_DN14357_c0_g1_i1.p1 TRINITY_DN14357_c0_g1~~TRINITY_DN14357_c0_g1_i1.p1  ORF type:complete len:321 (-),score=95.72 TRINITY_DN14357_c0_g1_i1:187-1149(-)
MMKYIFIVLVVLLLSQLTFQENSLSYTTVSQTTSFSSSPSAIPAKISVTKNSQSIYASFSTNTTMNSDPRFDGAQFVIEYWDDHNELKIREVQNITNNNIVSTNLAFKYAPCLPVMTGTWNTTVTFAPGEYNQLPSISVSLYIASMDAEITHDSVEVDDIANFQTLFFKPADELVNTSYNITFEGNNIDNLSQVYTSIDIYETCPVEFDPSKALIHKTIAGSKTSETITIDSIKSKNYYIVLLNGIAPSNYKNIKGQGIKINLPNSGSSSSSGGLSGLDITLIVVGVIVAILLVVVAIGAVIAVGMYMKSKRDRQIYEAV